MLPVVIIAATLIAVTQSRPNSIDLHNVVTVPPNCPPGQEWINGQCRDVWRISVVDPNQTYTDFVVYARGVENQNAVVVPPNCKPGQQLVNGVCRDVWRSGTGTQNVVTVPPNCPSGQVLVNGYCRDVWVKNLRDSKLFTSLRENIERYKRDFEFEADGLGDRNIISVPNQCPQGYKPDALGYCREIFAM